MSAPIPWKSISDMLIQNKCWLCTQTFPRGKKKKVFTVNQVLHSFSSTFDASSVETPDGRLTFFTDFVEQLPHVHACYSNFCYMNGDVKKISRELEKIDIAPWMSGLVCCSNDLCKAAFNAISAENPTSVGNSDQLNAALAKHNVNDCPPGCGCDNPWQFMAI